MTPNRDFVIEQLRAVLGREPTEGEVASFLAELERQAALEMATKQAEAEAEWTATKLREAEAESQLALEAEQARLDTEVEAERVAAEIAAQEEVDRLESASAALSMTAIVEEEADAQRSSEKENKLRAEAAAAEASAKADAEAAAASIKAQEDAKAELLLESAGPAEFLVEETPIGSDQLPRFTIENGAIFTRLPNWTFGEAPKIEFHEPLPIGTTDATPDEMIFADGARGAVEVVEQFDKTEMRANLIEQITGLGEKWNEMTSEINEYQFEMLHPNHQVFVDPPAPAIDAGVVVVGVMIAATAAEHIKKWLDRNPEALEPVSKDEADILPPADLSLVQPDMENAATLNAAIEVAAAQVQQCDVSEAAATETAKAEEALEAIRNTYALNTIIDPESYRVLDAVMEAQIEPFATQFAARLQEIDQGVATNLVSDDIAFDLRTAAIAELVNEFEAAHRCADWGEIREMAMDASVSAQQTVTSSEAVEIISGSESDRSATHRSEDGASANLKEEVDADILDAWNAASIEIMSVGPSMGVSTGGSSGLA